MTRHARSAQLAWSVKTTTESARRGWVIFGRDPSGDSLNRLPRIACALRIIRTFSLRVRSWTLRVCVCVVHARHVPERVLWAKDERNRTEFDFGVESDTVFFVPPTTDARVYDPLCTSCPFIVLARRRAKRKTTAKKKKYKRTSTGTSTRYRSTFLENKNFDFSNFQSDPDAARVPYEIIMII